MPAAMADDAILVPCAHCEAMNRLPPTRLADAPACGRCGKPVFAGAPLVLTAATFDRHALRSGVPLLVDFWAPWCGPCRTMAPAFEQAARVLEPSVRLGKLDTEAEPSLGTRYAIRSIPTLVLFAQGREIARQSGAIGAAQIVDWTRAQLAGSRG